MTHHTNQYDSAYQAFQSWRDQVHDQLKQPFSEADTRARFIDPLLINVLGWPDHSDNLSREWTYVDDDGRHAIDYLFTLTDPILVVEAKRNLAHFEIPSTSNLIRYTLTGVMTKWNNAWSAVTQARKYCDAKGARYALITNGLQFIAFQAISECSHWTKGQALVLRDLDTLEQHFTLFYECFSYSEIAHGKLSLTLRPEHDPVVRQRLRTMVPDPGTGFRNKLVDVIQSTLDPVLLDVGDPTPEFLSECYCTSNDVEHFRTRLDGLISDPMPTFRSPIYPARPGRKQDRFHATVRSLVSTAAGQLIVVIGGVGVGKTAFLQWYFQVHAPREKLTTIVAIHLDFRKIDVDSSALHETVVQRSIRALQVEVPDLLSTFTQKKQIFREQIDAAKKGTLYPYRDDPVLVEQKISDLIASLEDGMEDHLLALVQYLQNHCNRRVIIVLDNMDQKDAHQQVSLYHAAQQLALSMPAIVLIAMRERTYSRLSRDAAIDAFSPVEFHVRAQPVDVIIQKRLDFISARVSNTRATLHSAGGIQLTVQDIPRFVNVLRRSLVGPNADIRILECIASLANANIRAQLRLLHTFLVSGQTKIDEYFWTYARNKSKHIPFHEVLHSLLFADRKLFAEAEGGTFLNVLEPFPGPHASHFTLLRLLALLNTRASGEELRAEHYMEYEILASTLGRLGITKEELSWHLQRARHYGLIADDRGDELYQAESHRYSITTCGRYYLNTLVYEFPYLAAVALDTSVPQCEYLAQSKPVLEEVLQQEKLPLLTRLEISKRFLKYLSGCEQREQTAAVARTPSSPIAGVFVPRMLEAWKFVAVRSKK